MMKFSALLVLLALCNNVVLERAVAFAPPTSFSKSSSSTTFNNNNNKVSTLPPSSSALFVGTASSAVAMEVEEGDTAALIMARAARCANEAYCSLDDLQQSLDAVLHVQSECVAQASALYKNPVCDNVQVAAEVVGKLRHKIREAKRLAPLKVSVNLMNGLAAALVVALLLSGVILHPHVPVDGATTTMAMASSAMSSASATSDMTATPFLTQEIWWAIRDGYLPTLMAEYLQHGGLMVDPTYDGLASVQFTPQEWWWSARDGYLPTLLEHYTKSGGLLVDASYSYDYDAMGSTNTVPSLEPREVMWSIRDGYLAQAASHVFRNGGL